MNTPPNTTPATPPPSPPPPRERTKVVVATATYVKALVILLFWILIGSAALGVFYLGMRGIWWALRLALEAIGI